MLSVCGVLAALILSVTLRRRLIGLLRQPNIRVKCRQLYRRLWFDFGLHRGRRRLDRILCHNRSRRRLFDRDFHPGRPTLDESLGHDKVVAYNNFAALPFASANVKRKTGDANQSNWHIAIFNEPLGQQIAPSPYSLGSFPHSRLHRQEKCVESKPYVSRAPVLIYRRSSFNGSQKPRSFLLVFDELDVSQTERISGERRQSR